MNQILLCLERVALLPYLHDFHSHELNKNTLSLSSENFSHSKVQQSFNNRFWFKINNSMLLYIIKKGTIFKIITIKKNTLCCFRRFWNFFKIIYDNCLANRQRFCKMSMTFLYKMLNWAWIHVIYAYNKKMLPWLDMTSTFFTWYAWSWIKQTPFLMKLIFQFKGSTKF